MRTVVLATRNPDKVYELSSILSRTVWDLRSLETFPEVGEIVEDGTTFLENAFKKARSAHAVIGLPCLADDSGLEVDALGGDPGVYSSRYAGAKATAGENNSKLLKTLRDVPIEKRTARFRCVAAFVDGSREKWVEGICDGLILFALRGDKGFGYDPLFFIPEKQKTFAEIASEEKNQISHRAKAFRGMAEWMQQEYLLK